MKRLFLVLLLINALHAKGQGFSGVQDFISSGSPDCGAATGAMAFDSQNNRYILGAFRGTLDVDAGPNIHSFTSIGIVNNSFLLKEDAAGNFVWAKHFAGLSPGSNAIYSYALDFDALGSIYIGGIIRDSFDMDPGPGIYRFSTGGAQVAFILKLDSLGNFVWTKKHEVSFPINNTSGITGMKVVGDAIYAVAGFGGTVDLDPGPGSFNVTATPGVGTDMAIVRMDTAGNFIWAKTIGGPGIDNLTSLATDSAANLFITGGFQNTVDFNPGTGVDALTSKGNSNIFEASDLFVAKYDSAGNYLWAKAVSSGSQDFGWKITVDPHGNVLTTGYFGGTADFDPGAGVYNLVTPPGTVRNIFTLKLYNSGNFAWARMAVGGGLSEGRAIAVDHAGSVYTAAVAPGGCDVDPGPGVHLVGGNCIVQKLDSSGNFVWGIGWQADVSASVGLDKNDSVYVTGVFSGANKDFDPGPGAFLLSGNSDGSGFILRLNQFPVPTSIEDARLNAEVSVYPNPSSGVVIFSSPFVINRVEVTDMAGKRVYRNEPARAMTTVDLSGNAKGVYFYEVDCGAGKQRGKLMNY